jgi:hypothetical protein
MFSKKNVSQAERTKLVVRKDAKYYPQFVKVNEMHRLKVEAITTDEQFLKLESLWNDLLTQSDTNVLYLTHEWLSTWWKCHKSTLKNLLVLLVYDNDELIGIAPFMKIRSRFLFININRIEFISMMGFAYSPENISASLDIIVKRGKHTEVISSIIKYLFDNKSTWQFLRLHPILCQSATLVSLKKESAKIGFYFQQRYIFSNIVVNTAKSWDEYCKERGNGFYKNYKRIKQKISKLGDVVIQEFSQPSDFNYEKILEIERNSWKVKKGIGIDSVIYKNFYTQFSNIAVLKSWLNLWLLEVNGKPIAYDLTIQYFNNVESLKSSYDENYNSYSPGNLLTYRELEKYIESSVNSMNLLWGNDDSKMKWTTDTEAHSEVFIHSNTLISHTIFLLAHKLLLYRIYHRLKGNIEWLYGLFKAFIKI